MISVSEEQLKQLGQIADESEHLKTLTELELEHNKTVNWVYRVYIAHLSLKTYADGDFYTTKDLSQHLINKNRELSDALDNRSSQYTQRVRSKIYSHFSLEVLDELRRTLEIIGHSRQFAPSNKDLDSIISEIKKRPVKRVNPGFWGC